MEDPYTILEVGRDASDDAITQSYRRLALKLHPDKNKLRNATADFQRLGQAYETLKDATKRWAYDLSPPLFTPGVSFSWTWNKTSTTFTGTFNFTTPSTYGSSTAPQQQSYHPPPAPKRGSDHSHDKAKIASIRKARNARNMNWHKSWRGFQDRIVQHKSDIQILKQQIKNLQAKRDAAEPLQAVENFLERPEISSDSKRQEDIEKEKLQKERTRQERRLEQVMKEERLQVKQAELVREEEECKKKEQEFRDAEAADEIAIAALRERVKKEAARQYREYAQQEQSRETGQQDNDTEEMEACRHEGWWNKNEGRKHCPECGVSWTYLLECSQCAKQACPSCRRAVQIAAQRR